MQNCNEKNIWRIVPQTTRVPGRLHSEKATAHTGSDSSPEFVRDWMPEDVKAELVAKQHARAVELLCEHVGRFSLDGNHERAGEFSFGVVEILEREKAYGRALRHARKALRHYRLARVEQDAASELESLRAVKRTMQKLVALRLPEILREIGALNRGNPLNRTQDDLMKVAGLHVEKVRLLRWQAFRCQGSRDVLVNETRQAAKVLEEAGNIPAALSHLRASVKIRMNVLADESVSVSREEREAWQRDVNRTKEKIASLCAR